MKIQSVLYENEAAGIERFLTAAAACHQPHGYRLILHLGDCSGHPLLAPEAVAYWQQELMRGYDIDFRYTFFDANLGFGRGHNTLWHEFSPAERLLVINPDALPAFHLLTRLLHLADACHDCGAVEARQIPLEHPKHFNAVTYETSWVSGTCCLFDSAAFQTCRGFDETFFLYCEDVDLSWRLRAAGYRLYYCLDTFVYHAKQLVAGRVAVSTAEHYHGTLSSLLLRAKYGRADLNQPVLDWLRAEPSPLHDRICAEYGRLRLAVTPASNREREAALFTPLGEFAEHRWTYPLPEEPV